MKVNHVVRSTALTTLTLLVLASRGGIVVRAQQIVRSAAGYFAFRGPLEAKVVTGAPYSAEAITESTQTLSDGNRIVQRSTGRVYRDGQGRVRREEDRAGGVATIFFTDPVANVAYSLDPDNRMAWQMPPMSTVRITKTFELPVPPPPPNGLPAPLAEPFGPVPFQKSDVLLLTGERTNLFYSAGSPNQQPSEEKLPGRRIDGVNVQGVRRTTTIPAGALGNEQAIVIVSEEWFSPELQILVTTEHRDPRFGTSIYRLTNILKTEPDRSLFEVPSDYTIQKSDLMRKTLPPPPPLPPRRER